ncbi:MAG: YdcF family protein [candidate division WOR-3 bacterium]|nr:YdcF family protein [candidate division WOR-3 bacterium]
MILYILSISPTTDFLQLFIKVNNNSDFNKPDVIFILGAGLSDESISRIVKGYEVYKSYNVPIVISGYKAEVKMMKSKLSNFSIPDSMIILDSLSRNTKENVRNFIKIAKERKFRNIIVISSYYHLKRIKNEFSNSSLNIKLIASNPIDYTAKNFLDIVPSYSAFSRNMIYINEIIGIYVNSFKIFGYVK